MSPANQPDRRLTAACRTFLREGLPEGAAWAEHLRGCVFCASRSAAKRALASVLSTPVPPPSALHSAAFLDAIRSRIVEQSEQSMLGALLEKGMPVELPVGVADAFPDGLLETDLARRTIANPQPATEAAWSRVRTRVLGDLAEHRVRRFGRAKGVALASVAAAAIICAMLVSEGTQPAPTIVITDISAMPAVEFSPMAVLRHGANH